MGSHVLLGVVVGAYGVRGQVRLRSFASSPCDIGSYGVLRDESGEREFVISSVRLVRGDIVVCSLSGIDSRDSAEALIGLELYISRDSLGSSDDGSYYHVDLLGLLVVDESGMELGEVINICNYGGGDLLEVRISSGSDILLLFNRDNVLSVGDSIVLSSLGVEALSDVEG